MTFANPEYFFLLLFLPLMIHWYWKKQKQQIVELQVSTIKVFQSVPRSWRQRFRHTLFLLRILAVIFLIISLARPQSTSKGENVSTEGIDIVLVNDISGSMLAEDFRPNRIEAAKKTAIDFIDGRLTDRIGLVVFSGESFTQCPLTLDHAVLKNVLSEIKSGMIEDGTAIGMGLATAVSRLKDSKAKSKVIVLLTDGINNRGFIDPMTAAGIAQEFGIRVYTIGVGTIGMAPYPVQTPFGTQYQNVPVEIDEKLLQQIADQTGGKYYRATDNKKLKAIYDEIDRLEKTKIEVTQFRRHKEEYYTTAIFAGLFLVLELIFAQTLFRKIP
ncbi:MAG: VWA domain-containing protein [Ignavibacteriales bacterium]|nr:VWA domain-containing protein [Ignavibacteriales bacterium]